MIVKAAFNRRSAGVKVWEKFFAGQIHCLIGSMPGSQALQEYEMLVQTVIMKIFKKIAK